MKTDTHSEIIISKEDAVFWMDGNGRWHNQHGEFEHKKVVAYFNRSIGYDADGYFVSQVRENRVEKVYFPYQETALFAVDIIQNNDLHVLLNTQKRVPLNPEKLFIRNDNLFMHLKNQIIKFTDRCMIKLSDWFDDANGQFTIHLNKTRYTIQEE
jgi:hypothetical protein